MPRFALVVEYDGTAFNGWQLQRGSNVRSVQGELERALSLVADRPIRLQCAGRTDTGVHATHQVVHFDTDSLREEQAWMKGANANLSADVAVRRAKSTHDDFHARFSAHSRRYRYLIHNQPVRSALARQYLTWVRQPLDVELMHNEAQALLGERDFTSFRAASCQSSTPMRHVDFIKISRFDERIVIDIQANAFLHHMVRNIVGSLIKVGKGYVPPGWIAQLLEARDRTLAADTAPANGLYLVQVNYPKQFGLDIDLPGPLLVP